MSFKFSVCLKFVSLVWLLDFLRSGIIPDISFKKGRALSVGLMLIRVGKL